MLFSMSSKVALDFPDLSGSREGCYHAMVLDHLGLSLHKLCQVSPDAFQLHHVASLGLQIVSVIIPICLMLELSSNICCRYPVWSISIPTILFTMTSNLKIPHGRWRTQRYSTSYRLWSCKAVLSSIITYPHSNWTTRSTYWYTSFHVHQQSPWARTEP